MVLLVHGDAAFAGEGVVQETLNLSQLDGYTTGGTLHVIVNNQLGFTTSPAEGRSTTYASDVAKMLQIPIFHVNGEHPESVAQVVDLAMDFRAQFHRDVVIDMYCYRRWGHNEADEPGFTQPLLYKAIERQPSVRDGYLEHLLELGGVTRDEAEQHRQRASRETRTRLRAGAPEGLPTGAETADGDLAGISRRPRTGGRRSEDRRFSGQLADLLLRLTQTPEGFHLHKKLERSVEHRREMAERQTAARLVGGRGAGLRRRLASTGIRFGSRARIRSAAHSASAMPSCTMSSTGQPFCPLEQLADEQASVEIINSPLSESGVLGFRVWLQPRLSRGARRLGGSVRRFRERGASDHRPVHRRGRRSLAALERTGPACCPTDWKAWAPNIRVPGWNGS